MKFLESDKSMLFWDSGLSTVARARQRRVSLPEKKIQWKSLDQHLVNSFDDKIELKKKKHRGANNIFTLLPITTITYINTLHEMIVVFLLWETWEQGLTFLG